MHIAWNSLPNFYLLSFIYEHQLLSEGFLLHKCKVLSFCQKITFFVHHCWYLGPVGMSSVKWRQNIKENSEEHPLYVKQATALQLKLAATADAAVNKKVKTKAGGLTAI